MVISTGLAIFLKYATYLACTVSFLVLSGVQIEKYFKKQTSIAKSYNLAQSQKMPNLAFCSKSPFSPDAHWSAELENYVANVPNVTFRSFYTSTEDQYRTWDDPFRYSYLDTLFNGRCQLLESDIVMAAGTYVSLQAVKEDVIKSKSLLVYFLNPGDEWFLLHQAWGSNVAVKSTLTQSTILSMQVKNYISLPDSGVGCHEPGEVNQTQCFKQVIKKALAKKKFECIPNIFQMLAPSDTKFCKSGQEKIAKEVIIFVMSKSEMIRNTTECKKPCHLTVYNVIKSDYGVLKGLPFREKSDGGKMDFHFYFPSTASSVEQEYYVYDFSSVLSAIGGGLGLFLGFSCLGGALAFFEEISKWNAHK